MPSGAEFAPVLLNPSEFLVPLGFLPFPNILYPYIAAFALETFFYGIYLVLFSICLYVLIRRRATIHWILPVLTIAMFSIATADIFYTVYIHFHYALKGSLTFHTLRPKFFFFVTNNILADSTFLYRCYVVWGGDLRILTLPSLLYVASVVCGYALEVNPSMLVVYIQGWKYITVTFVLNVTLTGLTAGRIWWYSWKRRDALNRRSRKRYQIAMATVIESGMLVAIYMIPEFIITNVILDTTYVQVCGIVPTLIVVQVALGRAVNPNEDSESGEISTMGPMQAAERATTRSHIVSFFSSIKMPVGKKNDGSISSGSIEVYSDQQRTGDVEKCDSAQEKSTEGRGPETV